MENNNILNAIDCIAAAKNYIEVEKNILPFCEEMDTAIKALDVSLRQLRLILKGQQQ
jgi:thermostable 8-oxoguanine DNA glycosylase